MACLNRYRFYANEPIFDLILLHTYQIIDWISIYYYSLLFTAALIIFIKFIIVLCHRYRYGLDRVLLWYR